MHNLLMDVRLAARLVRKSPWFAFVVVLTLGLGIGVNTATFSVAHHFLLEPLPFPQLDRLMVVLEHRPNQPSFEFNNVSPGDFFDWQKENQSFARLAAMQNRTVNLTGDGDPERVPASAVTANFFDALGVHAQLGRTFGADGEQPVVVLGDNLWRRRFGADPNLVGRSLSWTAKTSLSSAC
jgi:hypothetical protein